MFDEQHYKKSLKGGPGSAPDIDSEMYNNIIIQHNNGTYYYM